jgi:serine/threonine protein kinase
MTCWLNWSAGVNCSPDIVLELVKGGDLLDRILKRGGLPEDETRDIVYQICDALSVSISPN